MKNLIYISISILLLACVKEYPEKKTIFITAECPNEISLDSPDTLHIDVVSESHIENITLLEDEMELFYKYYKYNEDEEPFLHFTNQFKYDAKSKGTKKLELIVESRISRVSQTVTFVVN